MPKNKYMVEMSFVSRRVIKAKSVLEALDKAHAIMETRSVYDDDKLKEMHDEAYCAGGTGDDPPLKRKRVYKLRDKSFEPRTPIVKRVTEAGA